MSSKRRQATTEKIWAVNCTDRTGSFAGTSLWRAERAPFVQAGGKGGRGCKALALLPLAAVAVGRVVLIEEEGRDLRQV